MPANDSTAAVLRLEIRSGSRAGETIAPTVPCTIGRAADATIHLGDSHLSQHHGRIDARDGAFLYADRGSSNGSIHARGDTETPLGHGCPEVELWNGDELRLGDARDPVVVRVQVTEADDTEVVAVRAIADVDAMAGRVAAEPGRIGLLHRFSRELGASTDLDTVLEIAGRMVFALLPQATHLAVALREPGGRCPVVFARTRDGAKVNAPLSHTILKRVLDQRAGLLSTNAATEFAAARSVVQAGLASALSVPLWTGDEIRGVIQVDNRDAPGLFTTAELELLTVAAAHISFAAQNARLVARLRLAEQRLERENRYLKHKEQTTTFQGIIGDSDGMGRVLEGVERVRDTRVPVLITGETGTGKEVIARAIHYTSRRAENLFVAQNCSAVPENLLESELFGHMRGAFTGADRDKKGLFELADGGTMFLDEIGEMPTLLQSKLLRVLQEGEICPVGAARPKRVDVRIVSATHRDLEKMVASGAFRQDLFYRLHVFPLRLPALRERREDIPMLARHFLARYAREFGLVASRFSTDALDCFVAYDWPGNVRELQNEIQRVLIQKRQGEVILVDDLSTQVRGGRTNLGGDVLPRGPLKEMMENVERTLLARSLREHDNNKTQTAEALGITREGLHKKLARFGMKK